MFFMAKESPLSLFFNKKKIQCIWSFVKGVMIKIVSTDLSFRECVINIFSSYVWQFWLLFFLFLLLNVAE